MTEKAARPNSARRRAAPIITHRSGSRSVGRTELLSRNYDLDPVEAPSDAGGIPLTLAGKGWGLLSSTVVLNWNLRWRMPFALPPWWIGKPRTGWSLRQWNRSGMRCRRCGKGIWAFGSFIDHWICAQYTTGSFVKKKGGNHQDYRLVPHCFRPQQSLPEERCRNGWGKQETLYLVTTLLFQPGQLLRLINPFRDNGKLQAMR